MVGAPTLPRLYILHSIHNSTPSIYPSVVLYRPCIHSIMYAVRSITFYLKCTTVQIKPWHSILIKAHLLAGCSEPGTHMSDDALDELLEAREPQQRNSASLKSETDLPKFSDRPADHTHHQDMESLRNINRCMVNVSRLIKLIIYIA